MEVGIINLVPTGLVSRWVLVGSMPSLMVNFSHLEDVLASAEQLKDVCIH